MDRDHIIIDRNHLYLSAMSLEVYQVIPGLWKVRWRDFLSMKQDVEFSSESEAREFHDHIWSNAHKIPKDLLDDVCTSYEEASAFWESIA